MLTALAATIVLAGPTLELHVDGPGMMRFVREGRTVFAKTASLVVREGQLRHFDGPALLPSIPVPAGAVALDVDLQGNVYSVKTGGATKLGRLVLALFEDESRLVGDADFWLSPERARTGNPGEGANGVVRRIAAGPKTIAKRSDAAPSGKPAPGNWKAGIASVRIEPDTQIGPGLVMLAQVAVIDGDPGLVKALGAISLFQAPPVGAGRTIDRQLVLGRIRSAKIEMEGLEVSVPKGAKVRHRSQAVPQESFVELAKQEARRRLGLEIPLRCLDALPDFIAPAGELRLDAERCVKDETRVAVTIAVRVDGKRINARQITLLPDASAEGVKAGAAIKIFFRAGGAEVEASGRARTAGWVGQVVTVVTDSGSTHSAIVTGLNRVQVKL